MIRTIVRCMCTVVVLCGCQTRVRPGAAAAPLRERGAAAPLQSRTISAEELVRLRTIAMLSLDLDSDLRRQGGIAESASSMLERAASELDTVQVRHEHRAATTSRASATALVAGDPLSRARTLGADGALVTTLTGFRRLSGSELGAEQTAKVDFFMRLLSAKTGTAVWEGSFHFEDEPLSRNMLKLGARLQHGQGAGWQRENVLLERGFREALAALEADREAAFGGRGKGQGAVQ